MKKEYDDNKHNRHLFSSSDQEEFDDKENFGMGDEYEDEEEEEDIFNKPIEEDDTPKPRKEKEPRLSSDDPRYWDREESRWEHLRPNRPTMIMLTALGCLLAIGLLWWGYSQLFGTCVQEAVQYGYVENVKKEGKVFQTFEGVMIPYREISDTTRIYDHDFVFSIKNDTIAAWMLHMQQCGIPVRVEYKVYNTALPWRGNSRIMVVKADTANPRTILPPEFAPQRY